MHTELVTASEGSYFLGEGPVWDPIRSRILWVDICAGSVFSGSLRPDGKIEVVESVEIDETVGAVGVCEDGEWIIAAAREIVIRGRDGDLRDGPNLIPSGSGRRLNDGKADPAGRYLVGTLSLTGPSETESLVSIDGDGRVLTLDEDLTLSNGLAWSADGRTLYSIDTERRVAFRRPYDPATGHAGPRSVFITIDDGYPDGMTIDAEEHLWIAIWGAGEVRRYSPFGALVDTLRLPAPHTTSVAFAGPDLDTLVITTATQDLRSEQRAEYPLSGHIFTTRTGVRGRPLPLWGGETPDGARSSA